MGMGATGMSDEDGFGGGFQMDQGDPSGDHVDLALALQQSLDDKKANGKVDDVE